MVSLNNSKDIVANSIRIINAQGELEDVMDVIDNSVSGVTGLPPETLNTIEAVANAIDNNPNYFSDTQTAINAKADKTTTYTKTEVDTSLGGKADKTTTYTKTEVDTAVGAKANAADVYDNY